MRALSAAVFVLAAGAARAATYVVNSTLDSDDAAADGLCDDGAGHCTLRAAITEANRDSAKDTIAFAIPGTGVHTISPATVLPTIVESITIDATTQPGYAGAPLIELAGSWTVRNGIVFNLGGTARSCSVSGLALYDFNNVAITVSNATCTIAANFVGLTATGAVSTGSTQNRIGIYVNSTTANPVTIGGATTADRNVISGNNNAGGAAGIFLEYGSSGADIIGNYIGTNPAGTAIVDSTQIGIGGNGTHVIEQNLISGNSIGLRTNGGASALTIKNNLIGTDVSGTAAVANDFGVELTTAGNTVVGNTISGNNRGVYLDGTSAVSGNVIAGNLIGTTSSGTGAVANGNGVSLNGSVTNNTIGGNVATARNIISGNNVGVIVMLQNATDSIIGNYIGLDINGNADANLYGVDVTGSSRGFTVGGAQPDQRNIISGNTTAGVLFQTTQSPGNSLLGNYIGTSADGLSARPNGIGVVLDTAAYVNIGDASGGGNLISGNTGPGISFTSVSVSSPTQRITVAGNHIGVDANGGPLPNQIGVLIDTYSRDNVIGGTTGAGNVIRSNAQAGVVIKSSGVNDRIQANAIAGNGALGIDLGGDGITANDVGDADSGPNQLQNFPLITGAASDGTNSWFTGSLSSSQSTTYTLEFFASPSCDPSGNGEGATYLGSFTTTTDASANASFFTSLPGATGGMFVTATAYNASSGTSEFSACQAIKSCPVIAVTPSMLPDGQIGTPYSQSLGASSGSAPYVFSVTSGSLTGGLALATDGTLVGTPSAGGDFAFTISATDADGCVGAHAYTLHVADLAADLAVAVGPDLGSAADDLGDTSGDDLALSPAADLSGGLHGSGGCGCYVAGRHGADNGAWACCAIFVALGVSRWRRDRGRRR